LATAVPPPLDLLDDLLGRGHISAGAICCAARIVDHDLRALGRCQQRYLASDAAARAGDDHNLAVQ
jgi:hypothetical protein